MSAWICHQRPESAFCAFSAAAWSSSEGQMKSGTSPALGCDATGWPQLRPTSSREHFSSPFTFCLPPEPPSNPAELQRGSQYDEWSGFSEWPDNRFHGGSCPVRLTLLLMCVYFRQDVPSRPRLWLVCPSGTLGKLRRGLCDGGASSEARTCSSRGFSKTGKLYDFSFVRAHPVTPGQRFTRSCWFQRICGFEFSGVRVREQRRSLWWSSQSQEEEEEEEKHRRRGRFWHSGTVK